MVSLPFRYRFRGSVLPQYTLPTRLPVSFSSKIVRRSPEILSLWRISISLPNRKRFRESWLVRNMYGFRRMKYFGEAKFVNGLSNMRVISLTNNPAQFPSSTQWAGVEEAYGT